MTAIKVLHIVGGGEFGGAERSILDLLQWLPDPFEPIVACFYSGRFASALRHANIPCVVVPNRGRYDWRLTGELQRILRDFDVRLVHTHGVRANFFGRLAARKENIPVVTTVHSNLEHDYPERFSRWIAWGMEHATRSLSKSMIAVSHGIRDELIRSGVPAAKVTVIHNGIDVALWQRQAREKPAKSLREELGLAATVPLVGMVARLHPVKGYPIFLQAAARLVEKGIPAHFVSIGEGYWKDDLHELAKQLLPDDRYTFLGFREQVAPLLAELDIHVNASLAEGLGLSILEAMAVGVPVVAARVGGIPDIIENGHNGLLFEAGDSDALADHLERLLRDRDLAKQLATAGVQTVTEKFSLERAAEQTAQCYRDVLS